MIVLVVIVLLGWWWFGSQPPAPAAMEPAMDMGTTTAATSAAPAQAIQTRDGSDASLSADAQDINGQMTQLNADSQAAQQ